MATPSQKRGVSVPFDSQAPAEVTARDRMIRLRDFLAALPDERFNMLDLMIDENGDPAGDNQSPAVFLSRCGTAACVAGWSNYLYRAQDVEAGPSAAAFDLGLNPRQRYDLFLPPRFITHSHEYTRTRAVAVLDHYLATGEIDWAVA